MTSFALVSRVTDPCIGRIPVRNIWLLFLYASDLARFSDRFSAQMLEDDADLPSLVARLLAYAVELRLHRNLSRGYRRRHARLTRVRGRIDLLETAAHQLLERGRVACRFEELTVDTARNRLVRSALDHMAGRVPDRDLAHRCRTLAGDLGRSGVSGTRPSASEVAVDVIGRNEVEDRLMVALAGLAFELALPTEEEGPAALTIAERDVVATRKLFERAVGGFYRTELDRVDGWEVQQGTYLNWQIDQASPGVGAILPAMQTDVILENRRQGRRLVIDTKFTGILTAGWFREATLRSGYLYQMYAYLRSQCGRDPLAERAEGLLLHPAIDTELDENVTIQGHPIRFATVNLAASPAEIRARLLSLAIDTHRAAQSEQQTQLEKMA